MKSVITFVDVLTEGLIAWREQRTRQHQNVSINAFSEFLGYSRPAVNNWLLGKRSPDSSEQYKIAQKLSALMGNSVFEQLGFTAPDPQLLYISTKWTGLTPEQQGVVYKMVRQFIDE